MEYQTNVANEVHRFGVSFPGTDFESPSLTGINDFYPAGELSKSIIKDENHDGTSTKLHTTEEFTNKEGQIILKRTYALVNSAEEAHDTYYVYDDYGNLTFVIPPKANPLWVSTSAAERNELCYQYVYDKRNRLIKKRIPGKGWESIVYDIFDRPILTQDANLAEQNKWLFTKYDAFGRVVYTGFKVTTSSRQTLQDIADNHAEANITSNQANYEQRGSAISKGGIIIYYTDNTYPSIDLTGGGSDEILTVNYYDSYTDQDGLSIPTQNSFNEDITSNIQGLASVSKVKVLEQNTWITSLSAYDDKGRSIYTSSKNNYLNTTDINESKIDFVGTVLESKSTHTRSGNAPITTDEFFTYDHLDRPLTHQQSINANPWVTLSSLDYDEIGQNTIKEVGDALQTIKYSYNVRGWLKSINDPNNLGDDLFGFAISYNDPANGAQGLLNGNISGTSWKTANDNVLRFYNYTYDALNRIKVAGYNNENGDEPGWFNITNINYDKNGNLLTLNRAKKGSPTAGAAMDYLTYSYGNSSNKLTRVEDQYDNAGGFEDGTNSGDDYTYDSNGNMLSDANKGITDITYNHLNLPTSVSINGGQINYVYDASGIKLEKTTSQGHSTVYVQQFIYENDVLDALKHNEGYIGFTNGIEHYYHFLDNINNVRLVYGDVDGDGTINPSTEIFKEANYYPFGLTHQGYNDNTAPSGISAINRYLFGNKELQTELDLNWYDISARNYDPMIGRWMNSDPLAEQMRRHSPYNYGFNNPIFFMDPDGMSPCPNGDCPVTEYTGEGVAIGEDVVNKLDEVVVVGERWTTNTYASPLVYTQDPYGGERISGYEFGGNVQGSITYDVPASASLDVTAFSGQYTGQAEGTWSDEIKQGHIYGSASVHGVNAQINASVGNDDFNANINAQGSAFKAEAEFLAEGSFDSSNGYGGRVVAGAGAYVLEGSFKPSFTIFGKTVQLEFGSSVGSAHIGGELVGRATNSANWEVGAKANFGFGAGFKAGLIIKSDGISIRKNTAQKILNP
jgi:RHS repeat-associated protein